MSSKLNLYDNTRLEAARTCLRFYYYRHIRAWVPDKTSAPLVFGGAWHAGLEVLWKEPKEIYKSRASREHILEASHKAFIEEWVERGFKHPDDLSPDDIDDLGARTPVTAFEMMNAYIDAREHVFTSPSFQVLAIEQPFIVPLDPNDRHKFYVGRLDKKVRWQGRVQAFEQKTTSLYRINGGFEATWCESWSMAPQVDGYNYALHMDHGDDAGGTFIDAALVHKKQRAFKLIPVDKQFDQLDAFLYDVHTEINTIESNLAVLEEHSKLDTPYLAAFPRNRNSCTGKYGQCPYFDLCRMNANPARLTETPMGFKVEKWEPFEELGLEKLLPAGDTP